MIDRYRKLVRCFTLCNRVFAGNGYKRRVLWTRRCFIGNRIGDAAGVRIHVNRGKVCIGNGPDRDRKGLCTLSKCIVNRIDSKGGSVTSRWNNHGANTREVRAVLCNTTVSEGDGNVVSNTFSRLIKEDNKGTRRITLNDGVVAQYRYQGRLLLQQVDLTQHILENSEQFFFCSFTALG